MKTPVILRPTRQLGFVLVITISVLMLLALVAVGMLSLSSISVRASSRDASLLEARANARLAMMLALGELQKELGPDQRISANGGILSESQVGNPHWTGVWDSWHAGETVGDSPDTPSEHQTIRGVTNDGMHPTYEDNRNDHFRSWLVSLEQNEVGQLDTPNSLSLNGTLEPGKDENAILLVGQGALGTNSVADDFVSARLITLEGDTPGRPRGRYGWWVGDESQKARIMDDSYELDTNLSLAENIYRHQSTGSTGTTSIEGLENFSKEEQLAILPTRWTLDLVDSATDQASDNFHSTTPFSYQVLADVREGGLKRDLSTLLERPINESESQDEFMLYRFDSRGQERVPLQDLAAYYQLYDSDPQSQRDRRGGVNFNSALLRNGIQISNPDFGGGGNTFNREYTNLYRLPVPIKLQFLLSTVATVRTEAEKRANPENTDTHKLHIGITPSTTLWNPYNVPLVMNSGNPEDLATQMRLFNLPIAIRWTKKDSYTSQRGTSLAWVTNGTAQNGDRDTGFTLFFSGNRPIKFAPGEVKVFSLGSSSLNRLDNTDVFKDDREVVPGWNPNMFLTMTRSERTHDPKHVEPLTIDDSVGALTFNATDMISFTIEPTEETDLANGSALQFFMRQSSVSKAGDWMARHYQLCSRMGKQTGNPAVIPAQLSEFNKQLMQKSFPDEAATLTFDERSGSSIIRAPYRPFLLVSLMAGCETHEDSSQTDYAGRHFPSRPFLHSTSITGSSFIDRIDDDAFYHHGWNWWVEKINSVLEANVQVTQENRGFYGGGYTQESGTTHVVQQEIPVVPPISIASLSHAHLGGFSLANENLGSGPSNTVDTFQRTTASGQGGLFPHTLQAIGNSYAHPYIPADQAYTTWNRNFSEDISPRNVTLADHSYLANKALWDEYFFSSLTPRTTQVFDLDSRGTAIEVAQRFFFEDEPLLNRRMVPYLANLDDRKLGLMFRRAQIVEGGMADELASHLMVEGPFNVNSTSVEAWRIFLSSLKGKQISYLDRDRSANGGMTLEKDTPQGTPVSSFSLPNGKPHTGSETDPASPEQWASWRELTDQEIEELAEAIVRQVKKRGPFLSLSEFVNRRLDDSDRELSVKGALQAAIDDEQVSINEGFREPARRFTSGQITKLAPEFEEALEGPVAYGSAAYVDQADVLRNFAAQLTPRGDTYVIRTYGDALDTSGNVKARAWCEAVVQRVPDYLDSGTDEPHLKQSELQSETNKEFGRKFRIVSFRFLRKDEV